MSHTDISRDLRILKEMESIKHSFPQLQIMGVGIKKNTLKSQNNRTSFNKNILSATLKSKQFLFFPKIFRYFLVYIEFLIKTLIFLKNKEILVIHCHDYIILPIGLFIKILFGSKLVYDAHELESSNEKNYLKFSIKSKIIFFLEKIIWNKVDLFITVSPSILNWYQKEFGYKKNSIIVLNSPEITNVKIFKKNSLRKLLKISKGQLIFLYVGSLQHGRGINNVLKAFSNSKINSNLVFIGYGELANKIKLYSKKYKNIYILKSVPHHQLVSLIKSADIGLCLIEKISLSDYYCLPNKFFEFAFANLHILASNFPDMKKMIKKYSLGSCIEPNDVELLKKIKLFENNINKMKIKKNNLINLSWKMQSKKLVNSYKKLIEFGI